MAYKDKHGITDIISEKKQGLALSLSWDNEGAMLIADEDEQFIKNPDWPGPKFPVILFTPNMDDPSRHHHIELTREQASLLRDWMDEYLKDTE